MGLLARALEYNQEIHSVLGLLERSTRILQTNLVHNNSLPHISISKDQALLSTIISTIGIFENTIDAPYIALNSLSTIVSNFEAIYLISDINRENIIPSYFLPRNNRYTNINFNNIRKYSSIQILSSKDSEWTNMFPNNTSLKKVVIIPITNNEKYFIITNGELLNLTNDYIFYISLTLLNSLQKNIFRQRTYNNFLPFPQFIKQAQKSEVFTLSKKEAFNAISQAGSKAGLNINQKSAIEVHCIEVLGQIVQNNGFISMNSEFFALYIPELNYIDKSMLIKQLAVSFQLAFTLNIDISSIEFSCIHVQNLVQSM